MKKIFVIGSLVCFIISCGENKSADKASEGNVKQSSSADNKKAGDKPSYDPHRGEGKFTNVVIGSTLDMAMAEKGNKLLNITKLTNNFFIENF